MDVISERSFLESTADGWPVRMNVRVYSGMTYECGCGLKHELRAHRVLSELPKMRIVVLCPKEEAINCVKIKGFFRVRLETLFAARHGASAKSAPDDGVGTLDDVLFQHVMFKVDELFSSYLLPHPRTTPTGQRFVQYPACALCGEPTSMAGNMTNMVMLRISDPEEFNAEHGMSCAKHASELSGQLIVKLKLTDPDVESAMAAGRERAQTNAAEVKRHMVAYTVKGSDGSSRTVYMDDDESTAGGSRPQHGQVACLDCSTPNESGATFCEGCGVILL